MVASVCLDVAFCFVVLTIISLLSYTGLPSNCSGLTTSPRMEARPLTYYINLLLFSHLTKHDSAGRGSGEPATSWIYDNRLQ